MLRIRRVYLTSVGRRTDIGLQLGKLSLLSLEQVRVEFFFISSVPVQLSFLLLSFISSTISSISFPPFSERRHKMTHSDV